MNESVNQYLKDVKLLFPIFQKEEKAYFQRIKENILKEANYENMTYDQCVDKYGEPTDIINSYFDEMDSQSLIMKIRKQKITKRVIWTIGVVLILCIFIAFLWRIYILNKEYEDFHNSIPTEYNEVIEEIE